MKRMVDGEGGLDAHEARSRSEGHGMVRAVIAVVRSPVRRLN